MKRVFKYIGRMKLRNKILVCFLLLISLAFAITTYSSYNVVSNLMENEVNELAAISVSQISKNIDLYLDELYRLTNMALADESFRRAIRASTGSSQQMSDSTNEIFQFLFNIHLYRSDLHSTVLYTPSGKVYTQGYIKYIEEKTTAALEPWCQEMMTDSTAHFRVVGQRTAELWPGHGSTLEVFTVARRIADINGQLLGVLVLNTYYDSLMDIFETVTNKNNARLYLQNVQGELLWQSMDDANAARNENVPFSTEGYVSISQPVSMVDWQVTIAVPRNQLFANVNSALASFYSLVIISLLGIVLMYSIFAYTFTKPLHRLTQGMQRVGKGDFSVSVPPASMDEIGELTVGFNNMTQQIKQLLNRMVEMEVREKESEYLVLQSQINPHFLYNTLEAIRMRCIVHKEREIAEVINNLSNLFRLSISRKERFVSLREELEHVKSYILVQNFRFDQKYHLDVQVADELLDYKTFKLMLQPLVENCVFHGLELKPEIGHIRISAEKAEENLVIRIEDDGVGISEANLAQLRDFLAHPSEHPDRRSLGLRTVHERIRLFFGEECGLQIESQQDEGTRITLVMPAFVDEKEVTFYV